MRAPAEGLVDRLEEGAEVSGPSIVGQRSQDGAAAAEPSTPSPRLKRDEYVHLIALQRRYAELAADDPDRRWRREQLISGYLPVAEHIACRFAGRGEPLDDLL